MQITEYICVKDEDLVMYVQRMKPAAVLSQNFSAPFSTAENNCHSFQKDPNCRRSRLAAPGEFVEYLYKDTRTLYEVFLRGNRQSSNGPCLGHRPPGSSSFEWISYSETLLRAEYLASALIHLGLPAKNTTCVGIFSKNRPEVSRLFNNKWMPGID
jgi:hypothetical protein